MKPARDGDGQGPRPHPAGGQPEALVIPGLGFTVVMCTKTTCHRVGGVSVRDRLAAIVRRCTHGMLVAADCPLGAGHCPTRRPAPEATVLLVQRCLGQDRRPIGPTLVLGPIRTVDDLEEVCRWLRRPDLDPAAIPARLRFARRHLRAHLN